MTALGVALIGLALVLILSAVRGEDVRDVIRQTLTGKR